MNYEDIQHHSIMHVLVEKEELNLFSTLKPKIYQDGDKWCVLLGDNIQEGVCGFGSSPRKAIMDFNKSFNEDLKA